MSIKRKDTVFDDSPAKKQDGHREKRKAKDQKHVDLYTEENNLTTWRKYSDFYSNTEQNY